MMEKTPANISFSAFFIVTAGALLLAVLTAAGPSMAQSCDDDTATQAQLNACAASELRAADAALNSTYRELTRKLAGPRARARLTNAQRAWIAFRDSECDFATASSIDGSAYAMLHAQCLALLTEERVRQLSGYMTCEEGDLGCPAP